MKWQGLAAGALVVLGLCSWTNSACAGDTMRLDLKKGDAARTMTLGGDVRADTVDTHWGVRGVGWRGGWGGGWRVGWGGGRTVWWGGARPIWWGGAGPVWWGARPAFVGPRVFWSGWSGPVVVGQSVIPSATLAASRFRTVLGGLTEEALPAPPLAPGDGTYPYDGGPNDPVPMPKADPAPKFKQDAPPVPGGRVAAVRAKVRKIIYRAYGEKLDPPAPALERTVAKKTGSGK